jgi:hypothetical protein
MNIVVFTAIFGTIDYLYPCLPDASANVRYICFTDRRRQERGIWSYDGFNQYPTMLDVSAAPVHPSWEQEIIELPYDNRRAARNIKTLAHEYLPGADVSIWIDGNVRLTVHPMTLLRSCFPKEAKFATFAHPDRRCVYQEARFCMKKGKGKRANIERQMAAYRNEGMPAGKGIAETKCVIRRHVESVAELNEAWWWQIQEYSVRDQISLPYVLYKSPLQMTTIPGRVALERWPGEHNPYFWMRKHVRKG